MPLSVGERLGPYEILAPIGAGGMGEVYKARDTRLDRIVAIKVSKEQFGERFEREARAVAALNHPHICALYDVGPNYLVMEYIDGQPLKGPMALSQALKYAAQICEALETAHRKGIVHRDLKPSNIMVTKAGVKLLDFGLARIAHRSGDSTVTLPGEVMGTPAYMAPEQWDGQPGDARVDIYAFGCVLYELLTGKRAAQELSGLEKQPTALASVLRTCLEKDPDERWQSARDLRRALALPIPDRGPGDHDTPWRERAAWILAAALAVGLSVALFFSARTSRAPSPGTLSQWTVFPPGETTFAGSVSAVTVSVPQFALAPDGRSLVFAAARTQAKPMLWLRPLDEIDARPLAGTEDAQNPFWSSDSLWIGFFAEGKLKKTPAAGGLVQVLADAQDPRGGAWNRDDTILFGHGSSGLSRVSAAGGEVSPATELDSARKEAYHRWPQFLPDGVHFLYSTQSALDSERGVYAGSMDGKVKKLLLHANSTAFYTSGVLLFQDGNTLQGQPFDPEGLELTGRPFLIAERVGRSTTQQGGFSASSNGILAYTGNILRPSRLTWFDRHGRASESIPPDGDYSDFRLSPDDRRLAVSLVDSGTGNPDIWIADLLRGGRQRLINSPNLNAYVVWSPDGSRIVFRANPSGIVELFQRGTAGGGGEQLVLSADGAVAGGIGSNTVAARRLVVRRENTPFVRVGKRLQRQRPLAAAGWRWEARPVPGLPRRPDARQLFARRRPDGLHLRRVREVRSERGNYAPLRQEISGVHQWRLRAALESRWARALLSVRRPQAHGRERRFRAFVWNAPGVVPNARGRRRQFAAHPLRSQPRRPALPDQHPDRRRGAGSNYSRAELAGRTEALTYPWCRKGRSFPYP